MMKTALTILLLLPALVHGVAEIRDITINPIDPVPGQDITLFFEVRSDALTQTDYAIALSADTIPDAGDDWVIDGTGTYDSTPSSWPAPLNMCPLSGAVTAAQNAVPTWLTETVMVRLPPTYFPCTSYYAVIPVQQDVLLGCLGDNQDWLRIDTWCPTPTPTPTFGPTFTVTPAVTPEPGPVKIKKIFAVPNPNPEEVMVLFFGKPDYAVASLHALSHAKIVDLPLLGIAGSWARFDIRDAAKAVPNGTYIVKVGLGRDGSVEDSGAAFTVILK